MPCGEIHTELSHHAQHGDLSRTGDFDPEQAAMLQDLARDGAPDDAQMYGYPEAGLNSVQLNSYGDGSPNSMQANGISRASDFAYNMNFTHSDAGLLQGQQDIDLDDPAALLESLANFEHPQSSSNAPISNDHFASLLQAAATAGGQETGHVNVGQARRSTRRSTVAEHIGVSQTPLTNKRSHNKQPDTRESHSPITRSKRRDRVSEEIEEAEQLARERDIWGSDEPEGEDASTFSIQYDHPPVCASDARAAGVHSAAALFRRPSTASRKYPSTVLLPLSDTY
jgi:hypothetical protein